MEVKQPTAHDPPQPTLKFNTHTLGWPGQLPGISACLAVCVCVCVSECVTVWASAHLLSQDDSIEPVITSLTPNRFISLSADKL